MNTKIYEIDNKKTDTDRKTELKRLMIFLLLSFAISWIPAIILNLTVGYHEWFESGKMPFFSLPVLYGPALANLLTRKLTGEGMKNSLLSFKLKKYVRYYFIAIFLATPLSLAETFLTSLLYGDISAAAPEIALTDILPGFLMQFAVSPLLAFVTFGEEFGWRAYMNPKLTKLFGKKTAIIAGGIIWGFWYAVLTVEGHYFGRDYAGYPYAGILLMCLICTFTGIILMWLTDRTDSVYPACIMHAMINFGPGHLSVYFERGISPDFNPTIFQQTLTMFPAILAAAVFLLLMLKDAKSKTGSCK